MLAEQLATLDLIADGRLDCDIGKGYRCNEFNGFAIDMAEADVVCEGFSKLILKAWRHEERWSHDGPRWQFNGIVVEPPCVQNHTDRLARRTKTRGLVDALAETPDGGDKARIMHFKGPEEAIDGALIGSVKKIHARVDAIREGGVGALHTFSRKFITA